MKSLNRRYKNTFSDKSFVYSVVLGLFLLLLSLVISFYTAIYAMESASNSVTDIILNNIPVYDVHSIFIYGPLYLWLFVAILVLYDPQKIPFVLKNIALFIFIRSFFITLTHIGPFPDQINVLTTTDWMSKFSSGSDLFFSAHTGQPFLMALVFWDNKYLAFLFSATAIFFGVVVLLGHLHYSIDVLSAFFITYTIYHIAKVIFKKDKELFDKKQIDLGEINLGI